MSDKIRWGILGTGFISRAFATGLTVLPEAELVAVGSRGVESANDFGAAFDVPHRHASYEDLAADPNVDVVYIGTPHALHKENSLLCLNNGKAVLCEKPFTINAAEAQAVINLAREKQLFLMEAMWTRYLPVVIKTRQLVAEGAIGELQMITADLGFRAEFNPAGRLFDPQLGGGALLDVGVYAVSWASMLFGPPDEISSLAHLGDSHVDERAAIILSYKRGQLAMLYTAIRTSTPGEVILMGSEGRLRIHAPMFKPMKLTLTNTDGTEQMIELPLKGNGYNYQAAEVMRCMQAGLLESETMPLDETLAIMQTMDQIRAQWGLVYPME